MWTTHSVFNRDCNIKRAKFLEEHNANLNNLNRLLKAQSCHLYNRSWTTN